MFTFCLQGVSKMKAAILLFAIACVATACPGVYADHHNESVNLVGVWKATASSDEGEREITWTFKKENDKLKGVSLDGQSGEESNLDRIVVKGKKVTLEIDIEQDGNKGMIQVDAEEKSPGKLVGKWSIVSDEGTEYMSGEVTAMKEVAFAGEWAAVSILPDGSEYESVMSLKGENAKLAGKLDGQAGEIDIDKISMTDKGLQIEFEIEMEGNSFDVKIKAQPDGNDKLKGKWIANGDDGGEAAEGEWSAVRKNKGLAGKWDVVATVPDADDYHGTLTLEAKDGKYGGVSKSNDGEAKEIEAVKSDDKSIEFSTPFEYDGNKGTITVTAKQQEDGSLKGEWVLIGKDGNEWARESWKATR